MKQPVMGDAAEHVSGEPTFATILHGLLVPGEHGYWVAAVLSVEGAGLQGLPKHVKTELWGVEKKVISTKN